MVDRISTEVSWHHTTGGEAAGGRGRGKKGAERRRVSSRSIGRLTLRNGRFWEDPVRVIEATGTVIGMTRGADKGWRSSWKVQWEMISMATVIWTLQILVHHRNIIISSSSTTIIDQHRCRL